MVKITVIHGQWHQGSTFNISKQIIANLKFNEKQLDEFFMPGDGPKTCIGCYKCFYEGELACPQSEKVQKIVKSMEEANIIIIDSPAYCMGMTGHLKIFFDHLGYMWLPHRPNQNFFNKVGIVVSTASGAGAKKVTKDLSQQMFWLGIPKIIRYSKNVAAYSWETVLDKNKNKIKKDIIKLSKKVMKKVRKVSPGIKLRFMFSIMRMMHKHNDWNLYDKAHWESNGWLGINRPWKRKKGN